MADFATSGVLKQMDPFEPSWHHLLEDLANFEDNNGAAEALRRHYGKQIEYLRSVLELAKDLEFVRIAKLILTISESADAKLAFEMAQDPSKVETAERVVELSGSEKLLVSAALLLQAKAPKDSKIDQ